MKTIQYNTFGNRQVDNELTDFLNTLRDDPKDVKKIQRKVMRFIHDLNLTVWNIWLQQSSISKINMLYIGFKHIPYNRELIKKDYVTRLQNTNWRDPLKCKVNACIMERFRELEKEWAAKSKV